VGEAAPVRREAAVTRAGLLRPLQQGNQIPPTSLPSISLLSHEQCHAKSAVQPNVDVIDVRTNPIKRFVADGIVQQDGTFHQLDVIALATGFDSITGGLKDMTITGVGGEILADKWAKGTWTYLGISTARFPNFFL
jgi:hypothetical protein